MALAIAASDEAVYLAREGVVSGVVDRYRLLIGTPHLLGRLVETFGRYLADRVDRQASGVRKRSVFTTEVKMILLIIKIYL